jgi:hypothetical protein
MIKSIIAALAVSSALLAGSAFAEDSCSSLFPNDDVGFVNCYVTRAEVKSSLIHGCSGDSGASKMTQVALQEFGGGDINKFCEIQAPSDLDNCKTDLARWKKSNFDCFGQPDE